MFYVESGVEPWAASSSQSPDPARLAAAKRDLEERGLHVLTIEEVTIVVPSPCPANPCANGRALRVMIPATDEGLASARCFVDHVDTSTPPAARRTDCAPLHRS
jgi:hypothetical protein